MVRIKGDNNIIIGGNNNQVTKIHGTGAGKQFDIPQDDYLDLLVTIGRKLWVRGQKQFYYFTIIPLILSLLSGGYFIIKIMNDIKTGKQQSIFTLSILIISAFIVSIFGTLIRLSGSRTCQNKECSKHFAYREYKPQKHLGKGKYKGKIYHNIKQFLKCDFCGHELEYEYIDEEEIKSRE